MTTDAHPTDICMALAFASPLLYRDQTGLRYRSVRLYKSRSHHLVRSDLQSRPLPDHSGADL